MFIVLALSSVVYSVIQTTRQAELVQCNRGIIEQISNALRERDQADITAAMSAREADIQRRRVIILLLNRELGIGESVNLTSAELNDLVSDYVRAGDRRITDLDASIEQSRKAPVPEYSCLNGE